MSIDHDSRPEAAASTLAPGTTETRKDHGTTPEHTYTRRNVLRTALMGTGALFAAGGAAGLAYALTRGGGSQPETHSGGSLPSPEATRPEHLTVDALALPETLNPADFPAAFANLGTAMSYYITNGQPDAIPRLVPGTHIGNDGSVLLPGQFQLRADFFKDSRDQAKLLGIDRPDDPLSLDYAAWGMKIELLEQLTGQGADPRDPKLLTVAGRVRITMGDLPPLTTMTERPHSSNIEVPSTWETTMVLRKIHNISADGHYVYGTDFNGQEGAWMIAAVNDMKALPTNMTTTGLPKEFTSVPEMFG